MLIHGAVDNDIYPPLFGSSQRSFGLYRGLARAHRVRVLCLVPNRNAAPREARVDGVELRRRKAWYTTAAWRLERARLAPLFLAALGHRAAARRLLAELPGQAEVLAVDFNLTGLLEVAAAPLKVYLAQNVEVDFFRASAPRVAGGDFWAGQVRAFEARALERADLTITVSAEDAERLRTFYGASSERVEVIPNGYDETALSPPSPAQRARARAALGVGEHEYLCVFVGSDFRHNREALDLLVERVLPPLAADGCRLLAVGAVARRLAARREPWLIARPTAPELLPLLHAADAGLNPVSRGGGSNVKLPAYLAAGLAVVTTGFGLRGYGPLASCVTTVELQGLAEALRQRPRGWAARGEAAPAALEAYAWGRLGAQLGEVLARRLEPRAARGPEAGGRGG